MTEEDEALLRKQLCREDEGLANYRGGIFARIHELLLAAIADDLGEQQDALRPRLVTAAAIAALLSLEGNIHDKAEQRVAKAEALVVLDDAMLFLRGGIDALQNK
jgi:hypothetical protein